MPNSRIITLVAALLLTLISPLAIAADPTVLAVEPNYVTIALQGSSVRPGEAVYIGRSDGQLLEFRIEKIRGDRASAIPKASMAGIQVGAAVRSAASVGRSSVAGVYRQDAPLMSNAEAAKQRLDSAAQVAESERAGMNAFLGAVGGLASGGNPAAVNMNAQAYLAQQQTNAANGLPVDQSSPAELATRFSASTASRGALTSQSGSVSVPGSLAQRDADIAQNLTNQCNTQCAPLKNACAGSPPGQSACYRAAACICECFLRSDPRPVTPVIQSTHQKWQQCVTQNRATANSLK
jgi:hypothetical protein